MGRTNLFTNSDNSGHKKSERKGGVKEMKKILITIVAVMMLCLGSAYAMPIYLDLSGAGIAGTGDGVTGIFDKLGLLIQTTSTGSIYSPTFTDIGNVRVNSFIASTPVGDTEGLGSAWELTGGWAGLTGSVTSSTWIPTINQSVDTYAYMPGTGILNLFADSAVNSNFGTSIGSGDDVGFLDGTPIATFALTSGEGSLWYNDTGDGYENPDYLNRTPDDGEVDLVYRATFLQPGFWFTSSGIDLSTYLTAMPPLTVTFISHADTDEVSQTIYPNGTVITLSEHDGSASVVVPEPTTLLLLGSGLLGLAGAGFRRRKRIA